MKKTLVAGSAKAQLMKKLNIRFSDENGRTEFETASGAKIYASSLEQGSEVYDGGNNLMINAEFVVNDKTYLTDENGKITSITDVEAEQIEFSDEEIEVIQEIVDEVKEEAEAVIDEKDAKIKELEAKVAELESKLSETSGELVQMKANSRKKAKFNFSEDKAGNAKGGFLSSIKKHIG